MAAEPRSRQRDWTVAPGEILSEVLEERGMSQSELARRMGRPIKTINEIANGKAAITPETAIQLDLALGISAAFWNNLEASYRAHLAWERADEELATHATWAAEFPIRDLVKHDLINVGDTKASKVAAVLRFFQVSTPEAWEKNWTAAAAAYRRSEAFEASPQASAAWLRWGEIVAAEIQTDPFDAEHFRTVLAEIREMTKRDFALIRQRIVDLCASAGVALVITPEFAGTHVSGAARWLTPDKAIIQLSLRHKTDDQFWFSFFHEAGHLLDKKKTDHLDADPARVEAEDVASDEAAANRFARDTLIAPDLYMEFVAVGDFSEPAIRSFARKLNLAPGILVGRLQRDGHVARTRLRFLKKTIHPAG
ncbi:MAG TPA: HigA family addiction module antitoxin [Solirubrobacteraceae bacterium]|nr:HigA family addiction module antitoxin [Solirubrobacteraceae bacterium]